ncbi:hypothetical protein H8B09_27045 [Paenibacillus sp. PR3]|uniref:Carboxypeptidase regulatory-like domain-containing protein n=1 Tax=Paenibacillus terricola TaxID=2763503 RepID=A0ABR8N6H8_9BACL|nr:carboxypeptidase-like regulatory domain-containing protein [Paenibacillus terricola]MBD3922439.1 hypothetical protein [Paenibacillus terricola]
MDRLQYGDSTLRLSVVVQLRDRLSPDGSAIGQLRVRAVETDQYARRTPSGYHVLTDMPPGTYTIAIESAYYNPAALQAGVAAEPGIPPPLVVDLRPNRTYPLQDGATLLRGAVREIGGNAGVGAAVTAALHGPQTSVKARLREPAAAGDDSLQLTGIQGELKAGDILYVRDADAGRTEYAVLREPLPADPASGPWLLAAPLAAAHPANTPLHGTDTLETVQTTADKDGEFVLPFVRLNARAMFARLTLASASGGGSLQLDASVQDGKASSLGVLTLK